MKKRQGFTLLELMIVVVILGVLALLAVPAMLNAVDEARAGVSQGNLSAAASTLSSHMAMDSATFSLDDDVIGVLNDNTENPTGEGVAFVNGTCANGGEVGIDGNLDDGFTLTACDANGEVSMTKTLAPLAAVEEEPAG